MDADIEIRQGQEGTELEGFYCAFWKWGSDPGMHEQSIAILLGLAEPVEMP